MFIFNVRHGCFRRRASRLNAFDVLLDRWETFWFLFQHFDEGWENKVHRTHMHMSHQAYAQSEKLHPRQLFGMENNMLTGDALPQENAKCDCSTVDLRPANDRLEKIPDADYYIYVHTEYSSL